jgi:hypothetical protein
MVIGPAPETGAGFLFVPSVDELQEFKVQTSTFSPQYGWSMGNAVNAVTKSGTAALHGGLLEFVRNGRLDANNWFSNRDAVERPIVKRNQFGFNVGGPLLIPGLYQRRGRTFVFGSYEGLRQDTPVPITLTMPTVAEREGDFSRTFTGNGTPVTIYDPFSTRRQGGDLVRNPFPDNRIPQEKIDPVTRRLLAFFPLPNRPGIAPAGQQNFVGAMPAPFTRSELCGQSRCETALRGRGAAQLRPVRRDRFLPEYLASRVAQPRQRAAGTGSQSLLRCSRVRPFCGPPLSRAPQLGAYPH